MQKANARDVFLDATMIRRSCVYYGKNRVCKGRNASFPCLVVTLVCMNDSKYMAPKERFVKCGKNASWELSRLKP